MSKLFSLETSLKAFFITDSYDCHRYNCFLIHKGKLNNASISTSTRNKNQVSVSSISIRNKRSIGKPPRIFTVKLLNSLLPIIHQPPTDTGKGSVVDFLKGMKRLEYGVSFYLVNANTYLCGVVYSERNYRHTLNSLST